MPCPYAEKRGAVVYCKVIGKTVSPLAFPCLSRDRWKRCKYYRRAQQALEKRRAPAPSEATPRQAPRQEASPAAPPRPAEPPAPAAEPPALPISQRHSTPPPRARQVRTKGITLDGRPARNCLECIYYGANTRTCLLLGVEVRDPMNPPCAE